MKHRDILINLGVFALLFLAHAAMAQPGGGGPTPVPLDGGISIAIAGGTALGIRHYIKQRNRKHPNQSES